jgi:hypothetical protein
MHTSVKCSLYFLAALGLVSAAAAEERKAATKDPNRIICQKQGVVGSRLATKRICMTAAEWDIRKREDREALDKAQRQPQGPSGI